MVLVRGPAMGEAVRTVASPAVTWVIVVVMSVLTAVMVSAAVIADSRQARANSRRRLTGVPEPEVGGARLDASAALREPDVPAALTEGQTPFEAAGNTAARQGVPAPRTPRAAGAAGPGRHRRPDLDAAGEAPTRPDLPPQPAAPGRHAMPAPRSGDGDRAARSYARPGAPDDEDPGR